MLRPSFNGWGRAMTRSVMIRQRRARWRERLADQARSGLGAAAFGEKEGIATKTFYGWRARLRDSEGRQGAAPHRGRNPVPFIDLGAMSAGTQARDIHLELPGAVVLTMDRR